MYSAKTNTHHIRLLKFTDDNSSSVVAYMLQENNSGMSTYNPIKHLTFLQTTTNTLTIGEKNCSAPHTPCDSPSRNITVAKPEELPSSTSIILQTSSQAKFMAA